jgi:hypothetical protein
MQKHWRTKMAENRLARELEGRNAVERPKQWQPASTLPEPDKEPGYSYRWVRISSLNNPDAGNISSKLREGWEPVRIEEQPKYKYLASTNSQFKDSVEIAGLLLCKIPSEFMEQRKAHYSGKTQANMEAVDNTFMRENDPRMPLFREKQSKTSFGRGS